MLGERRSAILALIIDEYIRTGEPIGSKAICQMLPIAVSSATIRNEMARLSELGFIEQRHTSGGRVPKNKSYRFYVDNLLHPEVITDYEMQKINEALTVNAGDTDRLLADTARLLADITGSSSFYCTLADGFDCIQGVELIPTGGGKAMLVMLTVGGKIKSSVCKLNCPVDDEFRRAFYEVVNQKFIGVPLTDVTIATIQSASIYLGERIFDMLPVLSSLVSLCYEASQSELNFFGETNLLNHSELGDDVYKLLSFFTRKEKIINLLLNYAKTNNSVSLFIGEENPYYELKNTSTIVGVFTTSSNQKAVIGVIGSTRINYNRILPRINYIMTITSKLLKEGGVTYE